MLSELGSSLSVKLLPENLFVSIAGTVGKPCITKIKCCIHDGFVYFPRLKINNDWLYYIFETGEPYKGLGKLGTQLNLNTETIGSIKVPIPPKNEIENILEYIYDRTAQIDTLIAKKQRLLDLLTEKRSALITQAVTKGLNPNAPLKPSGVAWLGDIPAHWEVKKIQYVARLKSGESITAIEINDEGEYPVYGGNGHRGYFDSSTHEGDFVLIGRQGALCGNINYASGKFWASEHALVANPLITFNYFWLGELLKVMNLNQYSVSAAQPGLSVDNISKLQIPFPPFDEQTEIANHLFRIDEEIKKIENKTYELIQKLKEYRSALITSAVTGKIQIIQNHHYEEALV